MYNKGMLPDNTFKNKVVLITGGGTGLGKSMGEYLLKLGAKIIITSRKQNILDETCKEFDKISKGNTLALAGDVRNSSDVEKIIEYPTIKNLLLHTAGFSYNFLADPVGKEYDQLLF